MESFRPISLDSDVDAERMEARRRDMNGKLLVGTLGGS